MQGGCRCRDKVDMYGLGLSEQSESASSWTWQLVKGIRFGIGKKIGTPSMCIPLFAPVATISNNGFPVSTFQIGAILTLNLDFMWDAIKKDLVFMWASRRLYLDAQRAWLLIWVYYWVELTTEDILLYTSSTSRWCGKGLHLIHEQTVSPPQHGKSIRRQDEAWKITSNQIKHRRDMNSPSPRRQKLYPHLWGGHSLPWLYWYSLETSDYEAKQNCKLQTNRTIISRNSVLGQGKAKVIAYESK